MRVIWCLSILIKKYSTHILLIPYNQCNACVSVSLMRGYFDRFNRNLAHLNNIIADDILLKRKWEEWILDNSNYFLMSFEPYISRITKALYIRGFLPSFITERKIWHHKSS